MQGTNRYRLEWPNCKIGRKVFTLGHPLKGAIITNVEEGNPTYNVQVTILYPNGATKKTSRWELADYETMLSCMTNEIYLLRKQIEKLDQLALKLKENS